MRHAAPPASARLASSLTSFFLLFLSPLVLSPLALALFAGSASAATIGLGATIDCMQANAGAGTCGAGGTGNGTATITLDTDTNLLSWDISWSGLSAPASLMHFHGPALPDQNAGIQVTLDHTSNPSIGNQVITAQQASDLLDGLWVHQHPHRELPGRRDPRAGARAGADHGGHARPGPVHDGRGGSPPDLSGSERI